MQCDLRFHSGARMVDLGRRLHYCITVLCSYCSTVSLYLYYRITVLQSFCITFYCFNELPYYCITALLYWYIEIVAYRITVLLSFCITFSHKMQFWSAFSQLLMRFHSGAQMLDSGRNVGACQSRGNEDCIVLGLARERVLLYYCIILCYCITVVLYYCISVLLYYCLTVVLYHCIIAIL